MLVVNLPKNSISSEDSMDIPTEEDLVIHETQQSNGLNDLES